jgi:RNA polymerase sigma-70 factor (ECF subfamily)
VAAAGNITLLLHEAHEGNKDALARLSPVIYAELRRLAAHCMRDERADHTLQPTALVNEAYMLLVRQHSGWQNKAQFFAVAAEVMRRVLIDHARAKRGKKRGGGRCVSRSRFSGIALPPCRLLAPSG